MRVTSYLWGKVDISTSVEQQLSYIQVFVMCSDVEGCESSLVGHDTVTTCHTCYRLVQLRCHIPKRNTQNTDSREDVSTAHYTTGFLL